eukprot:SAG31_NODE_6010_length_2216_cov_1.300425_2_plen_155_part_01
MADMDAADGGTRAVEMIQAVLARYLQDSAACDRITTGTVLDTCVTGEQSGRAYLWRYDYNREMINTGLRDMQNLQREDADMAEIFELSSKIQHQANAQASKLQHQHLPEPQAAEAARDEAARIAAALEILNGHADSMAEKVKQGAAAAETAAAKA